MKRFFLFLIGSLLMISCQEKETIIVSDDDYVELDSESAKQEFAVILSKAVYENEALREFLKSEALTQFDKDYDVFYPWTKNELVTDGQSFRDILLRYDEKHILPRIEEVVPRLNILIPDWSWLDSFSVRSWETSDNDISVCYESTKDCQPIYFNGEKMFDMKPEEIPDFPILVVKENERMVASNIRTKGASVMAYDFLDEDFDASKAVTRVSHDYYDREFDTEDTTNFVPASQVSYVAVDAYNEFKNNPYAFHRDNIYYGMTNTITQGKLNVHICEYISKIKFETLECNFLFDDSNDFKDCPESNTRYVSVSDSYLINKFKYDGNLDLYFRIIVGNANGTVSETVKYKSVSFQDVFQLSKLHVKYRHNTLFGDPKWVFTVDKKCFIPKWFNANIQLPKWDISNQSATVNILVQEYDDETEITEETTISHTYVHDFKSEAEVSGKIGNEGATGKVKIGYGYNQTATDATKTTIKTKRGSDNLGAATLEYTDPVILSKERHNGVDGYRIKEIDTGFIYMLIMPRYE